MIDNAPGKPTGQGEDLAFLINEIQLLFAEKRTALSVMRTGIAFLALPLSVLSVLIATSRYYNPMHVMQLLVPVLILSAALAVLGIYLIARSLRRIHVLDRGISGLKRKVPMLTDIIL